MLLHICILRFGVQFGKHGNHVGQHRVDIAFRIVGNVQVVPCSPAADVVGGIAIDTHGELAVRVGLSKSPQLAVIHGTLESPWCAVYIIRHELPIDIPAVAQICIPRLGKGRRNSFLDCANEQLGGQLVFLVSQSRFLVIIVFHAASVCTQTIKSCCGILDGLLATESLSVTIPHVVAVVAVTVVGARPATAVVESTVDQGVTVKSTVQVCIRAIGVADADGQQVVTLCQIAAHLVREQDRTAVNISCLINQFAIQIGYTPVVMAGIEVKLTNLTDVANGEMTANPVGAVLSLPHSIVIGYGTCYTANRALDSAPRRIIETLAKPVVSGSGSIFLCKEILARPGLQGVLTVRQ